LKPFAPEEEIENFIKYGFARTRGEDHVIDEPIPIMAALNWLTTNGRFSVINFLQGEIGKHSPRKNAFEAYLAFYLRMVFTHAPKLDGVFTFRSDYARREYADLHWLADEFELVTVSTVAETGERKISVVTPSCGPSSNVGFSAATDGDVVNWISENAEQYAFCFPTVNAGPDILFFARSRITQELLLVAVQSKHQDKVSKSTLMEAVRTVTPSWFWKQKGKKVTTT
jgi:hypothetical protein